MHKKTDSELKQAVLNELKWDHRVDETEVGVEIDAGIVTLTGTVGSWAKRIAAQEAAHRVAGVLDVANDIQVRVPGSLGRSDTEIAAAVRRALEWDAFVDDSRIRSTVYNGWVTLGGNLDCWSDREDAERAIHNLVGVRGVTNHIEVKPAKIAAQSVQQAIEDALERRAERDAKRIDVAVLDGRVTLTGVAQSWQEKQTIVGAVRGTRGVRDIDDRIRIEPYAV